MGKKYDSHALMRERIRRHKEKWARKEEEE
jgi:hypothetical protein